MSTVSRLSVQHVRNHESLAVELSAKTTVITGANGSGKTSLIEALYIALQGSSFRGSDSDILSTDAPWYRIDAVLDDESKRTVKFDPSRSSGKKQFEIDGRTNYRLLAKYRYPVVLFEPDDLRLLSGSPTRRRYFIDHLISQIDPAYQIALRKYERALKQRNNLLKHAGASQDELFVWNVALSEYGAYIIGERTAFIEQLNQKLETRYQTIAATHDEVSVHYSHTLIGDMKQKLLSELSTSSYKDSLLGFTSVGPHRHDVIFEFNGSLAAKTASRGEARSAVLAIKFIEAELIEEITNQPPIMLLDDVYSELDAARQARLQDAESQYQIIITTTSAVKTKGAKIVTLQ